jgi:hypothetical protein
MTAEVRKSFFLGAGVFVATEAIWLAVVTILGSGSRWVMEPTPGLIVALLVHFIAGLGFAVLMRPRLAGLAAFVGGIFVGLVFALFVVGPGNLWPIVIFIDVVLIVPCLALGLGSGALIAAFRKNSAKDAEKWRISGRGAV